MNTHGGTRLKRALVIVLAGTVLAISLTGCGGGGGSRMETLPPDGGKRAIDIKGTIPFSEATSFERGKPMLVLANNAGTTVKSYDVFHLSSYQTGELKESLFQPATSDCFGAGHSGSPVCDQNGRLLGALYAGYDGGREFFVKSIESMLPLLHGSGNTSVQIATRSADKAFQSEWFVSGVDQKAMASFKGRTPDRLVFAAASPVRSSLVRSAGGVTSPQPGSTIAVQVLTGPIAHLEAFGALTYSEDGRRYVAFGHPLDQYGDRNLPVAMAFVDAVIDADANGTFKQCHAIGDTIGSLMGDYADGVVIDFGKRPETTPVEVNLDFKGQQKSWTHQLARDKGSDLEQYGLWVGLFAPLAQLDLEQTPLFANGKITIETEGAEPYELYFILPEAEGGLGIAGRTVRGGPTPGSEGKPLEQLLYDVSSKISEAMASSHQAGKPVVKALLEINFSEDSGYGKG